MVSAVLKLFVGSKSDEQTASMSNQNQNKEVNSNMAEQFKEPEQLEQLDYDPIVADAVKRLMELLEQRYGWFVNDDEAKQNTPIRIAKFYHEWFRDSQYQKWTEFDQANGITRQLLEELKTEVVDLHKALLLAEQLPVVRFTEIKIDSLCSHHMLPFFGKAYIAYIPKTKVLGASKFPRAVKAIAHKPHIQEGLTKELLDFIVDKVNPLAAYVKLYDVEHTCMTIRGIKEHNSKMTTEQMYLAPELENVDEHIIQIIVNKLRA